VTEAIHAYEYRDYKHADRAVAHDLRKLIELGRIKMSVGGCVSLVDADTVAVAARAQHQRSDGPGITGDVA
jgi:hypothetical protein